MDQIKKAQYRTGGQIHMENRLRQLFDFQKFEGNASLQQVIDDVHARYAVRLENAIGYI